MSFRVNNKHLLKNYNKIWEKIENLIRIDFESKPIYGDDDRYIKKIYIYIYMRAVWLEIFITKKFRKKKFHACVYE